jgi:hypothetical protein
MLSIFASKLRGEQKTLAHKKKSRNNGTELDVFQDRAARANAAIFEVLAKESPQTIKQILKNITRYEGLEETYYASLTKRLHNLTKNVFIEEMTKSQKGALTSYRLCVKAVLAMFLKENSM